MKKLVGLIGYPVSHSMSPEMQNAAFQRAGLDYEYDKYSVHPDVLEQAVQSLRDYSFAGCNVTIPHKQHVMRYLDEISPGAESIGAVNTIVNENGKLIGYNTDGAGFVQGLMRKLKTPLEDARILVIGAGGASRAICYALAESNSKTIAIANRTLEKANHIKEECMRPEDRVVTLNEAAETLSLYNIVINTTSIGMDKDTNLPLDLTNLVPGTVLSDIIYNPIKTHWLQEGERKSAIVDNGVAMLVYQGALAFEKWTGIKPDVQLMEEIVIEKLGGNYVNR